MGGFICSNNLLYIIFGVGRKSLVFHSGASFGGLHCIGFIVRRSDLNLLTPPYSITNLTYSDSALEGLVFTEDDLAIDDAAIVSVGGREAPWPSRRGPYIITGGESSTVAAEARYEALPKCAVVKAM